MFFYKISIKNYYKKNTVRVDDVGFFARSAKKNWNFNQLENVHISRVYARESDGV